ncbi:MAG: glycosyltransferase [Planctomycetes bacterium]|nr:glycosyltransferase [Planctomycetota bacterium]
MRWLIASAAHRPEQGGIGSYVAGFVEIAVAAGWEVHLLTRPGDRHPPGAIVHIVRTPDDDPAFDTRLDALRRIDRVRPYRYGSWALAVARTLLAIDVDVDVVEFVDSQAQGLVAIESAAVRSRFRDVPMVVSSHTPMHLVARLNGDDERRFGRHLYHDWERRALHAADGVFAPSHLLLDALDPVPVTAVIPAPVVGRPARKAGGRAGGSAETIVFAGGIEPAKGVVTWMRSLPAVLERHPRAEAVLIGPDRPGPGGSWVEHLRDGLRGSVRERVRWTGPLDHDAVAAEIDAATLVVVPSVFESFSYVAAEALVAGCPVVVSDRVGLAEIAPSVPIVPAGDAEAWAAAQLDALAHPNAARATALRGRAELLEACRGERLLEARRELVERSRVARGAVDPASEPDAIDAMESVLDAIERQEAAAARPRAEPAKCPRHLSRTTPASADEASMPLHSIVIPTRDRPALVGGAVRSALAQTVTDLEVVVSDNSTDDRTAEALRDVDDPRFRYERTPSPLLMHDSWQFALEQTRGERVAFLCDDDALHPETLELADGVRSLTGAEVVTWRSCSFLSLDWIVPAERGRVRFGAPFSDAVFEVDGERVLDLAYDLRVTLTDRVPKMLNCSVARATIDRARADGASLFRPSCPDYSAMVTLALFARGIVLIDAPLLVVGATPLSIGPSSVHDGEASRKFVEELRAREPEMIMPEVLGPAASWIGQTMMQCAHDIGGLADYTVDPVNLYGLVGVELTRSRDAGGDVEALAAAWNAALAGPLSDHADAIRAFVSERKVIESDAYLRRAPETPAVLGVGPFTVDDTDATAMDAEAIDDVAAAMPDWLDEHAIPLADLWDSVDERAGARRPVLYGLGTNGRALLRCLPARHPVRERLAVCDDADDDRGSWSAATSDDLDPARDFVLVTPSSAAGIRDRLASRGFRPERDMTTADELMRLRSCLTAQGFA